MNIGVPKEIKNSENRVGLTESGVKQLTKEGHRVFVEKSAGLGSGISDQSYEAAGATLLGSAKEIYDRADMIIKVKEPLPAEFPLLRENQILYTYLHLAAEPALTKVLCERRVKAVAYETIELADRSLPLLTPMSEVAGRMATQVGAYYLQKNHGGRGILLGGVTGTRRGRVVIVGGGIVGVNAAQMAAGLGAEVTILEVSRARMEYLNHIFQGRVTTLYSNVENIEQAVNDCDLLVGAVLITGRKAPVLVTRGMVGTMRPGSVVVDVAVDQGGCIETCRPTSHQEPIFVEGGVIHYCVPNMPGVVARTSTYALTNATMKYASALAALGVEAAVERDPELARGLNVYGGYVTYHPVATDLGLEYRPYARA